MPQIVKLDVVIFGGGAAGLWLLDHLLHTGYRTLLLETHTLGVRPNRCFPRHHPRGIEVHAQRFVHRIGRCH